MPSRIHVKSLLIRAVALLRADLLWLQWRKLDPHSQALVVMMHETPLALEPQLRAQLEWASQFFNITNLETFAGLWTNGSKPRADSKPLLLFTFDDGRQSNFTVAAPLLESFGGRGVFFIVPAFAETSQEKSREFYRSKINPDSMAENEPHEDWIPMNPTQIANLAARGHAIGNHTATHRRLVNRSQTELDHEIEDSARKLSHWTGKPIDTFAWTFGWDAIDAPAWQTIQRHHRFCFSPCAGFVDTRVDRPSLLWRREIEARYSPAEYRAAYSGLGDYWWRPRQSRLKAMLRAASASRLPAFGDSQ